MAAQELVVPDLQSDNFDLLRFPSLTGFPSLIESDDLNMMARMGSLFDAKQPATASSPQSANNAGLQHQQQHQTQQHMHHIPSPMQQLLSKPQQAMPFSPNSPEYPMLSPRSAAPEASPAYIPPRPAMMMSTPFALPAQTSFESDRSHHDFPGPSAEDAAESEYSDEESDPEQDATPRRSSRKRNATQASREGDNQDWSKPKKKVGRPITYNGDPNAPELTDAERRKVKRRIANRESARRVQQRRKEMIDELQHKLIYIQHHHHHLMQHLAKLELEKGQLHGHLTHLQQKWTKCTDENSRLHAQVASLQKHFEQQQQQQAGAAQGQR